MPTSNAKSKILFWSEKSMQCNLLWFCFFCNLQNSILQLSVHVVALPRQALPGQAEEPTNAGLDVAQDQGRARLVVQRMPYGVHALTQSAAARKDWPELRRLPAPRAAGEEGGRGTSTTTSSLLPEWTESTTTTTTTDHARLDAN